MYKKIILQLTYKQCCVYKSASFAKNEKFFIQAKGAYFFYHHPYRLAVMMISIFRNLILKEYFIKINS